jgi:hypothetical protein
LSGYVYHDQEVVPAIAGKRFQVRTEDYNGYCASDGTLPVMLYQEIIA